VRPSLQIPTNQSVADGTIKATSVQDVNGLFSKVSSGPTVFRSSGAAEDATAAASVSQAPINTLFAPAPGEAFSPTSALALGPSGAPTALAPGPGAAVAPGALAPGAARAGTNGTAAAPGPAGGQASGPSGRGAGGGKCLDSSSEECEDYESEEGPGDGDQGRASRIKPNEQRAAGDNSCERLPSCPGFAWLPVTKKRESKHEKCYIKTSLKGTTTTIHHHINYNLQWAPQDQALLHCCGVLHSCINNGGCRRPL
jgi:hypothetical protein